MFNLLVLTAQVAGICSILASLSTGDIQGVTAFFSILMTTAASITAVYFGDFS